MHIAELNAVTGDDLGSDLPRPDFYIASMGRTGSTMIANWLTLPPEQIVLIEPFLFALKNPTMLRTQLENLGLGATDAEWGFADTTWRGRFRRLLAPRLAGRRWALKEVLAAEHRPVLEYFAPPCVVVTVRDMRDIAASFMEKHRIQDNLHRFDDTWVLSYCLREAQEIVELCEFLSSRGTRWRVVRYEDFIRSDADRASLAEFVGWPGGGEVGRHLTQLGRGFETERHGNAINAASRRWEERTLHPLERAFAERIAAECTTYQTFFGY
ncbi:hypothetical protein EDF58_102505 [Novosphingobium sp. PhB57]|uniref:hypothetical protein n=1 Tax=Novosphingobium sp. PhB57 TaxID=2485107 RepID=UPI00104934EC|nr:hypothetical protein [Novosphingobium sp. PhB57]TCU59817.1 hypothetical protein EDF58_102505 [Novosphingobium sp. PhB57]